MWMKVDDRLHSHRKTRAVARTHDEKRRDIAPMGLWVAAGSWAGQNSTNGWVPEDELDRWDDDWPTLAARLVKAGYWWPEERDGEAGYGFVDWEDYNPSHGAAESGGFGNHIRWHVNRSIVDPECEHCPSEPDQGESPPEDRGESGGDIGGRSGSDIAPESRNVALPDPTRPEPDPNPTPLGANKSRRPTAKRKCRLPDDFRPDEQHIALAKSLGVDLRAEWPKFVDHWRGNGATKADWPAVLRNWIRNSRKYGGTTAPTTHLPHASEIEQPPDGLSDEEYADWYAKQRRRA